MLAYCWLTVAATPCMSGEAPYSQTHCFSSALTQVTHVATTTLNCYSPIVSKMVVIAWQKEAQVVHQRMAAVPARLTMNHVIYNTQVSAGTIEFFYFFV